MEKKLDFRHFNNMGYQKDESLPNVRWSKKLCDSEKIYYCIKLEDLVRTIKEKKFLVELKEHLDYIGMPLYNGKKSQLSFSSHKSIKICRSVWWRTKDYDFPHENDFCLIETTVKDLLRSLDFSQGKTLLGPVTYAKGQKQNYQNLLFNEAKSKQHLQEVRLCVLSQEKSIELPIKDTEMFLGTIRLVQNHKPIDKDELLEALK